MTTFNFNQEFADKIKSGKKRSTIRKNMKCKIGDTIHLYVGETKIAYAVCIGLAKLTLEEKRIWYCTGQIGRAFVGKRFAHQEGFDNENEMLNFFRKQYGLPFTGYLHTWEFKNNE